MVNFWQFLVVLKLFELIGTGHTERQDGWTLDRQNAICSDPTNIAYNLPDH